MLEDDERNLQETRHIPNEVSTAHQENFLARENQKRRPTQEQQQQQQQHLFFSYTRQFTVFDFTRR